MITKEDCKRTILDRRCSTFSLYRQWYRLHYSKAQQEGWMTELWDWKKKFTQRKMRIDNIIKRLGIEH